MVAFSSLKSSPRYPVISTSEVQEIILPAAVVDEDDEVRQVGLAFQIRIR